MKQILSLAIVMMLLISCSKEETLKQPSCAKVIYLSFKYGYDTTQAPLKIDTLWQPNYLICGDDLLRIKSLADTMMDFRTCSYYFKWEKREYQWKNVY